MRKAVSLQAALEVVKERQEEFMAHVTRKLLAAIVDQYCHEYHSHTDIGPRHAQAVAGFHPSLSTESSSFQPPGDFRFPGAFFACAKLIITRTVMYRNLM